MKKISLILVILVLLIGSCSLGISSESKNSERNSSLEEEEPVKSNSELYGMCYIANERNDADYTLDTQLMYNLGVGTVRNWIHITSYLENKSKVNTTACAEMHSILAEQKKLGMKIIGMSHTNFNKGSALSGKPERDLTENSYYQTWLLDYYTSWKTLVREFPEVDYWEIDNEINNSDFMKNISGEKVYSIQQMADISSDMLYYASRAIHSVDSSKKTVLGGITEPAGLGHGENVEFLQDLYENINSGEYGYIYGLESETKASTDPDDYFQIACWHPYVWTAFDKEYFISENNKIYDVILQYEPEGKEVFFTEIGFSNANYTEEETAAFITDLYAIVQEKLSYVKSITYFKLFDVAAKTWTGSYSRYGLFYDPHDREYTQAIGDTQTLLINGAPKKSAFAYQKSAKGVGNINLLIE